MKETLTSQTPNQPDAKYYSQAGQDQFILFCLNRKTNGTFVEIGSFDPILINNTFIQE